MENSRTPNELLQQILTDAFGARAFGTSDVATKASFEHPLDDEDLLLRWTSRQLSPVEHDELLAHLARCSDCRKGVAEMIRSGILEFQDGKAETVRSSVLSPSRKPFQTTWILGVVMTSSLCLLLCVFFFQENPDPTNVARNTGRDDDGVKLRGTADAPPESDRFALLVGIDKYAKLKPGEQLDGCRNDIEEIKRIVRDRFGFEESNITVLLDEQATADGVRKQLRELIRKVQSRDRDMPPAQVLFYFSGHGSRVPDSAGEDGYGATLVVHDSERQGSDTDILSAELNQFSHEICKDGRAELLIALDSCHSGGGARGITKFRGIDRDFQRDVPSPPSEGKSAPRTLPDGLTFLSACQSNQKEPEYRKDGKTYGLFTYHLVKLLESERIVSSLDYKTLADAIHRSYRRNKIAQAPTPTVEGDKDKIVFGVGRSADRKPYWETTLSGKGRGTVRMEAGSTAGITERSLFELYDTVEKTLDPTAESLGWFEIEKVDGVFSLGKFFKWSDESQTGRVEVVLPKGFKTGFAVQRYHDYGDNILAVRIVDAASGHTIEPSETAAIPAPIRSALTVFDKDESPWLHWVAKDGNCDIVLKFDSRAKMATLFPETGCGEDEQADSRTRDISDVPETLRGGWGPIEWGPEEGRWSLREHCRKIMIGLSLKRLVAEKAASVKTRGGTTMLVLEPKVFRPNDDGDFEEVKIDTRKGIVLECGDDESYQMRIKNNDDHPFYVTILAIDPDMEISQLSHGPASSPRRFNARVGTGNNPDANKLEGGDEIVSNFRFAEPYGLQTLIVLATREPSNFTSFVQSGLGRTRGGEKGTKSTNASRVFRFIDEQCGLGKRAVVEADVPRDDSWTVGTLDVIAEPGR